MVARVTMTYRAIANSEYRASVSLGDRLRVLTSGVERETTQTAS